MPDRQGTSVTHKVLAILAAFSPGRATLTLSELSRRASLSLPTTHRRVAELVDWGALERTADGRYRIGLRLWEVATLAPRGLGLRDVAMPFLQDLTKVAQRHVVHLAVREELDVVFVERMSGHGAPPVYSRAGGRFGDFATGVGLILLAFAPIEVQEAVLSSSLPTYTTRTITEPRRLRSLLADIRKRGYSVSDRMVDDNILSVGAPIHGPDGAVTAAISVAVAASSQSPSSLAPFVRTTALGISRSLGYQP
ncbi:IclR family transcriptional regulator [Saccharopolyspora sp. K220]|uniref:IclR family transcriptional regulator n=1 Tax=Saccharopolyspora soli TaxID=2926618 RepID=UPI001F57BD18|nr:IclR family transcriptional regulator [Saccharopolyspora soli]MCI2423612.1 IclR family transcriptional regulator [Saccharopolyspora soli]